MAAPTKPTSGKAASASMGATLALRLPRNRENWRRSDIDQPPGHRHGVRSAAVAALIRCVSEAFFPIIVRSHRNCLGVKHRNFGKITGALPVIAFRATDLIFATGVATVGTARQLPVNGAWLAVWQG